MTGIMKLANEHKIPVIEDTAQSFMATHHGKFVGSFRNRRLLQPAAGEAHHHR